jgi:hypothetical protein
MSCYGTVVNDRVEWSIPMSGYADDIYRLLKVIEESAEEYNIDTGAGDWFTAEIRPYAFRDHVSAYLDDPVEAPQFQLTFWFPKPKGTP